MCGNDFTVLVDLLAFAAFLVRTWRWIMNSSLFIAIINVATLIGITIWVNRFVPRLQHRHAIVQKDYEIKYQIFVDTVSISFKLLQATSSFIYEDEKMRVLKVLSAAELEKRKKSGEINKEDFDNWSYLLTTVVELSSDLAHCSARAKLMFDDQSIHAKLKGIYNASSLPSLQQVQFGSPLKQLLDLEIQQLEEILTSMKKEMKAMIRYKKS
jgi:hypothetical protein